MKTFLPEVLVKTITVLCALLVCGQTSVVLANPAHHQDYGEALDKAAQAEARIIREMERVQFAAVAHYDFLQYEHIELLRHARALAHPPADVPQSARADIQGESQELLSSASELEWVIADFLRTVAMLRNASSNTLDIASRLERNAAPKLASRLGNLKARTISFEEAGYESGWDELTAAFEAVLAMSADEQSRRELAFQRKTFQDNAPKVGQFRQQVSALGIHQHAKTLVDLYHR